MTGQEMASVLIAIAGSRPFWSLVGVLILALIFRVPILGLLTAIRGFIERSRTFRVPGGLALESGTPARQDPTSDTDRLLPVPTAQAESPTRSDDAAEAVSRLINNFPRWPYLDTVEQSVRTFLETQGLLKNPAEGMRFATKSMAYLLSALSFEQIWAQIYASQLLILTRLNAYNDGVGRPDLEPIYQTAVAQYPDVYQAYPFERYIDFLTRAGLVSERDAKYFITDHGRAFLAYIVHVGRDVALKRG